MSEYDMDGACSVHWGTEKCLQDFGKKAKREEATRKT